MFDTIRQDLARDRSENHKGLTGPAACFAPFTHLGTLSVLVHRFGHWAWTLPVPGLRHLALAVYFPLKFLVQVVAGVNIPVAAEIGPGLVIHTWNGVYLPNCRIGRNATFQHGVVVAYHCKGLGDDVYFGPGAKVIRNVRIGDRAAIGANAVVLHDVPVDCTVAGVPARIVSAESQTPDSRQR